MTTQKRGNPRYLCHPRFRQPLTTDTQIFRVTFTPTPAKTAKNPVYTYVNSPFVYLSIFPFYSEIL